MVDTPGHADFGGEVRFFIKFVPISQELIREEKKNVFFHKLS